MRIVNRKIWNIIERVPDFPTPSKWLQAIITPLTFTSLMHPEPCRLPGVIDLDLRSSGVH